MKGLFLYSNLFIILSIFSSFSTHKVWAQSSTGSNKGFGGDGVDNSIVKNHINNGNNNNNNDNDNNINAVPVNASPTPQENSPEPPPVNPLSYVSSYVASIPQKLGLTNPALRDGLNTFAGTMLGKPECVKRTVCIIGSYLKNMMPAKDLIFTFLTNFVPPQFAYLFNILQTSVMEGQDCNAYICTADQGQPR